jgi:hypothetical protein
MPTAMNTAIETSGWARTKSSACWSRCCAVSPLSLRGLALPVAADAGLCPGVEASLL